MTARMLATLALALGLTAFTGCSGGKDTGATDDTDGGDDDDDDDAVQTAETGDQGPDYFTPSIYAPFAYFGFDLDTNALITVDSANGEITPAIQILVGNAEWQASGLDTSRTDLYCVVELPLSDATFAPWAQKAGYWYGVDYVYDYPLTSCLVENGFEVDPAWTFGGGDGALAYVFQGAWGVALGEIGAEAAPILDGYPYTNIPEGSFYGAYWNDPILQDVVEGIGLAYQIDDAGMLTDVVLPTTAIHPATGITTAFYDLSNSYSVEVSL